MKFTQHKINCFHVYHSVAFLSFTIICYWLPPVTSSQMSSHQKETPQLLAFSNHSPSWSLDLSVLDISFRVNRIITVWYLVSGYFTETAVRGSSCNLCQAASLCGWVTLHGWRHFILHPLIGVLVAATFWFLWVCSCEHVHSCVFGYPFSTE